MNMKWDEVLKVLIFGLVLLGLVGIWQYNETMRIAFSQGYSNTIGWRK